MTSLRIERFGGMAPRLSDRLLPDNASASAKNARLLSGELRGIRQPSVTYEFASGPVLNARRLYKDDGTPVWMGLTTADTDIVKGPLVNDAYDRYYWTGEETYVAYNSIDRIENGDPEYRLGTPAPTAAPGISVTGGSGDTETRAYCYTFLNSWGEESEPSPVVVESGFIDGSWDLTSLQTTGTDMTDRLALANRRIYRTVTGQSSVEYFLVEEISMTGSTYSDTQDSATTVQNSILQSYEWTPPPDDLAGLVAHPNGFLVGFVGKDIYFSVPYRPHAWPLSYVLSLEYHVIGLAIYNNMITALTDGSPYFIAGNRPETLSPIKSDSAEPCLSKPSISSTLQGVMYASPNGIVLFNESGPNVVTSPIMTIEEWTDYSPETLRCTQYGEQYIGFYDSMNGIKFSPAQPFGVFCELDAISDIDNILTDETTGECWLLINDTVYRWEPPTGLPLYYTWKSKEYDFTRPINFGAYMVKMGNPTVQQQAAYFALLAAYNAERLSAAPLDPINFTNIGAGRTGGVNVGITPDGIDQIPQNQYPIGGSPLYDLDAEADYGLSVTLKVYADGELKYTTVAQPNALGRLPSGFKAHVWQFELVGNDDVFSFAVAEVPKELMNV